MKLFAKTCENLLLCKYSHKNFLLDLNGIRDLEEKSTFLTFAKNRQYFFVTVKA